MVFFAYRPLELLLRIVWWTWHFYVSAEPVTEDVAPLAKQTAINQHAYMDLEVFPRIIKNDGCVHMSCDLSLDILMNNRVIV